MSTYLVELSKWGITQGLPAKPYTDNDFLTANANIEGINKAIQYAYNNNYSEIMMPRGEYAVCYPNPIVMTSNLSLNFNQSTLKVIYDSDRQSPLDTADRTATKDYFNFVGNTIEMNGLENACVQNGNIIGCKADRSFSNPKEVAVESSYGIVLGKGTKFTSVRNCKIGYFMGDNLSIASSSPSAYAEFSLGLTANTVNDGTGQLTASTTGLTSDLIPVRKGSNGRNYPTVMVTGFGYTRQTALTTKETGFYFYKADGTYIGGFPRRKIYTEVTIPADADNLRLVFYDETNTNASSTTFQITLNYGGLPHHNIVEDNEIYYGHRGGITLGGSYNIILNNVIRDNGQGSTGFLTGNHNFNSTTRYSINQEDSYGDNSVIRNNLIQGSYHGILIGCYSVLIENNHIYNIDNTAINLYSLQFAVVKGNYMQNCTNNIGLMTAYLANAHVEVTQNSFHGGTVKLDAASYQVSVTHNQFENCIQILVGTDGIFKDNILQFMNRDPNSILDLGVRCPITNCEFVSKTQQKIVRFNQYRPSDPLRAKDCTFNNIYVQPQSEHAWFKKCEFTNSKILNLIYSPPSKSTYIEDSVLTDVTLQTGDINTPDALTSLHIKDSVLNISSPQELVSSEMNNTNITSCITLTHCKINLSSPMNYLYKSLSNGMIQLEIKGCNLVYTGITPLNLQYYNNASYISKYILADNRFNNIRLPAGSTTPITWYDPDKKTNGEPSQGYYFTGDHRTEETPKAGGNVGWICTAEGEACKTAWSPNTNYLLGSKIYNNTDVYEAITAGTSKNTIPSFPTTMNSTMDEMSELPEWGPSTAYKVGELVKPSKNYPYYMECIVAGTSGAAEPTWSTWADITDNTVKWRPRKSITWRQIAHKAEFLSYGSIS